MLGKLFKYEMKACARLLLPLILVLLALSVLERIILGLNIFSGALAIISGSITFLFVIANIAVAVLATVIIIFRFYKNLVSDEGYLMFTLPVKTHQLINSKLISGFLWTVVTFIVIIAALLLSFGTLRQADFFWLELKLLWKNYMELLGNNGVVFIVEMILAGIISIPCSILQIYASIAVGQLFSGHKILGSVVAYVVLTSAVQVVMIVIMVVVRFTFGDYFEDITFLVKLIMPISLVISLVFTIGCYIITNIIFNKKLNLE